MRITGVIDPFREQLRHEPDLRDFLRLPPPAEPDADTPEESDEHEQRAAANTPVGSAPTDPFTTATAEASALPLPPEPIPNSRPDAGAHHKGRP